MKRRFVLDAGLLSVALITGAMLASVSVAAATVATTPHDDAIAPYIVSIDEIAQTFVANHLFTGSYATAVTMANGSKRAIKLTPLIKEGMLVVHLEVLIDGRSARPNGNSYMGPNGTTSDGKLMVRLQNPDFPPSAWEWVSSHGKLAPVPAKGVTPNPAKTRFLVSVYEIKKNVVFGQSFSDHYTKRVTMADGSQRTIDITAENKDGKPAIKLDDSGRVEWLDPNGTAIDGKLTVLVGDMQSMAAASRKLVPHLPAK